ncbi:MAG: hypothetical protein AB7O96_15475 [Pseudobdellovibrionaceae bacterium]
MILDFFSNKKLIGKSFFSIAILMSSSISVADDGLYFGIHRTYENPRALGMGNAIVAAVNDYSALFLNPAAMARRDDGHLNMSIDIAATKSFQETFDKIEKTQQMPSSTSDEEKAKTAAMLKVIQDNYGENYSLRLTPMQGVYVNKGWGVGFIPLDSTIHLSMHNQFGPSINAVMYSDTTLAFGVADDMQWGQHGRLSMGTTFKLINRGHFSKSMNAFEMAENSKVIEDDDLTEGMTADVDIGMLYTPVLPTQGLFSLLRLTKPTFGLVVRNALDYGFTSDLNMYNKKEHGKPEQLYRRIDVGSKWEYPDLFIFNGRGVLDFRDILHPNATFKKTVHLGFEFDWRMASWWKGNYRIGINQGYMTLGASALLGIFNLDLVTWGEEVGTTKYPTESRTYMAKMSLDF